MTKTLYAWHNAKSIMLWLSLHPSFSATNPDSSPSWKVESPLELSVLDHWVVYLPNADKYRGLIHRPLQEQKGLDERALMASQRPSAP